MNKKAAHTSARCQVKKKKPQLGGEQFHDPWFLLLAADSDPLHAGNHFCYRKEVAY